MDRTLPAPAAYAGSRGGVLWKVPAVRIRRIRCASVSTTREQRPVSRTRRNALQFARFALVGGSGVVVNLVALVVVKRLGPHPEVALFALRPTEFHVRWYHLYSTIAFLVANLWNFQLNRCVDLPEQPAQGVVARVLAVPRRRHARPGDRPGAADPAHAPRLADRAPTDPLDDTTGLRTRLYWAQLIVIVVVTPLSFVLNKVWTFAAVRTHHLEAVPPHPMAEQELQQLGVDESDPA